jgi:hypothetical protein
LVALSHKKSNFNVLAHLDTNVVIASIKKPYPQWLDEREPIKFLDTSIRIKLENIMGTNIYLVYAKNIQILFMKCTAFTTIKAKNKTY